MAEIEVADQERGEITHVLAVRGRKAIAIANSI